jgi:hypothetical protein
MRKLKLLVVAAAVSVVTFGALAATDVITSFVGSPYLPLPTGVQSYQLDQTATTGNTMTFAKGQSEMVIVSSGTLSAFTINLNQNPPDGQVNCFYNKSAITTLTLSAPSTVTLNDALTGTSAATRYCYIFTASSQTWNRMQ